MKKTLFILILITVWSQVAVACDQATICKDRECSYRKKYINHLINDFCDTADRIKQLIKELEDEMLRGEYEKV